MRRFFFTLALGAMACAPAFALAGDQEVAQQIATNLRSSGRMQGYNIGVKVNEGTAWLGGTVRTQDQMQSAIEVAKQTPGITNVVNELTLETGAAQPTGVTNRIAGAGRSLTRRLTGQPVVGAPVGGQSAVKQAVASNEGNQTRLVANEEAEVMFPPAAPMQDTTSAPRTASNAPRPFAPAAGALSPQQMQQMQQMQQAHAQQAYAARAQQAAMLQAQGGDPQMAAAQPPALVPAPAYAPGPATGYGPGPAAGYGPGPMPSYGPPGQLPPARYDNPQMPGYAWPSYAAHPNYAALTYPKQYSPTAWPFIGPFYPYPQVPLGWRKVTLEWDDGWWMLDFKD